ncbi:MAG TPA: nucleoside 2-deoxyribosyltransferase [Planctomycetaceae bacterium]|nr:nucleoside 2-deoxyribosyltransferase [Planctomycetaceae bacterium]
MSDAAPECTCRVYCAGPLFNRSERLEMTAIADALCATGFEVFLPHRDGMEFRLVHEVLVDRGWPAATAARFLHGAIFALDVYQLAIECDGVVWNLNGRTPDEGAVSEAAIAWTLGKPLVAYRDDIRTLVAGRVNPLLVGLVEFETVEEIAAIPAALQGQLTRRPPRRYRASELPDRLQSAAQDGRRLWEAMRVADAYHDNDRIADVVADLFAPAARDRFRQPAS